MFEITSHPFYKKFRSYIVECCLIIIAIITAIVSVGLFITSTKQVQKPVQAVQPILEEVISTKDIDSTIFVEVSGGVMLPDVYEVTSGARLKEVIIKAGGLSADADSGFFGRNYNQAKILNDGDKIYIPTLIEVQNGLFNEQKKMVTVSYTESVESTENEESSDKIHINTDSVEKIDTLPGIGKITAEKIIDNRPYSTIQDLIDKEVVTQTVFDKIADKIEL